MRSRPEASRLGAHAVRVPELEQSLRRFSPSQWEESRYPSLDELVHATPSAAQLYD